MWGRLSNMAQNVQEKLDTVVDNVNKSVNVADESIDGVKLYFHSNCFKDRTPKLNLLK